MDEGYSQLGALLRNAREEKLITIEAAAQQLHIRVRYLQAIEEGRLSDLPGHAYAKGYVQAYATFLHLDRMEILRRFEQVEGVLSRKGFFFPQVFSKEKQAGNHAILGGLAVALVAYLLWAYAFSPDGKDISVIDSPEKLAPRVAISAATLRDVACLRRQDVLYPPCHVNAKRSPLWLPLGRAEYTIMELAKPVGENRE